MEALEDCHLDIAEGEHGPVELVEALPKNVSGLVLVKLDSMASADVVSGMKTLCTAS
jgi:hypothetical protein